MFSALLVLSDASSFFCFLARFMFAWVLFYVGLFSVRTFFLIIQKLEITTKQPAHNPTGKKDKGNADCRFFLFGEQSDGFGIQP